MTSRAIGSWGITSIYRIPTGWPAIIPACLSTTGHTFRNALLPLITVIGLSLPSLLGGSVIIEAIFGWAGLGTLSLTAVTQRDYPVIMGETLVVTVMLVGFTLLTDLAYVLIDPRIRLD